MPVPYEIIQEIAVLKEGRSFWRKELNLISWHGEAPKFDIRWWAQDREIAGKGVTFEPNELYQLAEIVIRLPREFYEQKLKG